MNGEKINPSQEPNREQEADLFFDGIGDLRECEGYLSNEVDQKTGQPWLDAIFEVHRAPDGKIITAKIKDQEAKNRFIILKNQIGARRAAALGKNSIRNYGVSPWKRRQAGTDNAPEETNVLRKTIERSLRVAGRNYDYLKPEEEIDLDMFTELLEEKIGKDEWAPKLIRGWNLIPMSSKSSKEPTFKLVVEFHDYGRKIFQGTHKEIEDSLNAELDRLEDFERGVMANDLE